MRWLRSPPRCWSSAAGPGGYVAAIRAGQLGLDTVLVEQWARGRAGRHLPQCRLHPVEGAHPCRRRVPSRPRSRRRRRRSAFASSAPTVDFARTIEWKDGIVGRLTSGVGALLEAAQGQDHPWPGRDARRQDLPRRRRHRPADDARPSMSCSPPARSRRSLPVLPFGGRVISSTEALSLPAVPERLAVVGAGYIGLELGTAFAKLGAKVTVVEAEDRILPAYDAELTRPVAAPPEGAGHRGADRRQGVGPVGRRQGPAGHPGRRSGARTSRPTRSSSPSGGGARTTGSASIGSISR